MGNPKHRLIAWSLWANKIAYLPVRADFAIYPALHIDNMFTFPSGIGSFLQYVNFAGNRFLFWKYLHFTFWKSVAYWSPPSGFTFLWYFQLSFWILFPFSWTFTSLTLNGLLYIVFWWKFTFLIEMGCIHPKSEQIGGDLLLSTKKLAEKVRISGQHNFATKVR